MKTKSRNYCIRYSILANDNEYPRETEILANSPSQARMLFTAQFDSSDCTFVIVSILPSHVKKRPMYRKDRKTI